MSWGSPLDISLDTSPLAPLNAYTGTHTHTARAQAILFKGKQLGSGESLTGAGVAEGDTLNVVPTKGEGVGAKARPVSELVSGE